MLGSPGRVNSALTTTIGGAIAVTIAANVVVLAARSLDREGPVRADPASLVSVPQEAQQASAVLPLRKRLVPHVLVASSAPLPTPVVERAQKIKGVAGVTVVDAAQTHIGGRPVGLLGVDPSAFRAFAPRHTAESDELWRTVAGGGVAVSFEIGRNALPLGQTVPAGSERKQGKVRIGAYASMGIPDVDAVVSREQASALGMPVGNAMVVSAPKADAATLKKKLRTVLPKGTKISVLTAQQREEASGAKPRAQKRPRFTGRPDGVTGRATTITGNMMTPTMRAVVMEVNQNFGPFPVIGCFRTTGDPQDHGKGRACDFMEGTTGAMPSAAAMRHGDEVAQYTVANARRLGISYVIWKQHIWNIRGGGWRPMENRGSITQNHFDHVHISVQR
ncbi:hypothetical protein [Actinomadura flavalba]|uniref:hypothetical protein n=1 Tax=Actinomadura flavalba TaxID=1120938 RepID=UPI00036A0B35|nr:hypothetical protein [Actinomadura flavalba]